MPVIKTYKGYYNGTHIIFDNNESVPARAYASNIKDLKDKKGFFNVSTEDGWEWGIIIQALLIEDDE